MSVPLISPPAMSETLMLRTAYIALGSNVGDRRATIAAAVAAIAAMPEIAVVRVAAPVETLPVDCPPGSPAFLNSAAELSTALEPAALLGTLHDIERTLGRERHVPNAARTIDLDLLLYNGAVVDSPTLIVPHPRMHQRRFVLEPLASIAPNVIHPVLGRSVAQLLADCV